MINQAQMSAQSIDAELEAIRASLSSYTLQWAEDMINDELYRELSVELIRRTEELQLLKDKISFKNEASNKNLKMSKISEEALPPKYQFDESNSQQERLKSQAHSNGAKANPTINVKVGQNNQHQDTDNVTEPDSMNSIDDRSIIVDIRDITKTYQMGDLDLKVLKGVTLQVRQGEFVSIMGPSGSGKSTLMNILGALDLSTSGEYYLDGTDVSQMTERQLAQIRNKKIGFVFQSFNLLKRTSALRQVELPLIYGTATNRTQMAKQALESVGLGQRMDHTPAELSGGQQQRVAIARAIVNEPSIILADEPTGNLDSRSGTEVMQIFQRMNKEQDITTIFVTHDTWIARHTDRVIMLRDGKIIADHQVKTPLVAGESERPSEAEELEKIFEDTYYGGSEQEYT